MSTVTYTYDPGTTVSVLIPGSCPSTYTAEMAVVNRVDIVVSPVAPTLSISYVVTLSSTNAVKTINEVDTFVDKPTAVLEAVSRYQSTFN
jgi:hypothetical protein